MNRISDRFLQLGVLGAVVGLGLGVWMGATENFTLRGVHVHINLLMWVSMLLYGIVYRVLPRAAEGKLPTLHFWTNVVGVLTMLPLLTLLFLGAAGTPVAGMTPDKVGPLLGVSTVVVWLSMLMFAVIVFRATRQAKVGAEDVKQAA
jgi:drug/metabolite transporter (DMT)-like permease